jgi:CHAT domain-containing protein/tetratricopeptide (TPR) repeat protein
MYNRRRPRNHGSHASSAVGFCLLPLTIVCLVVVCIGASAFALGVSSTANTQLVSRRFIPNRGRVASTGNEFSPLPSQPNPQQARQVGNAGSRVTEKNLSQRAAEDARKIEEYADRLCQTGKAEALQEALQKYETARGIFATIGNKQKNFSLFTKIGALQETLGHPQQALDAYAKALRIVRQTGDYRQECEVLNRLGTTSSHVGKSQQALNYYRQSVELSRQQRDKKEEARALKYLGESLYDLNDLASSREYLNQSLKLWETLADAPPRAEVLKYLGYVHTDLSELSAALNYYQQALQFYQTSRDSRGEAETTNAIGLVYALLGEREKAIEHYSEAEKSFRAVGDRRGLITALNGRGAIYASIGSERALDCHFEALQISREIGDLHGQIIAMRYLGNVYRALGDHSGFLGDDQSARDSYTRAIEQYRQALALTRDLKDRRIEAYLLQDLGSLSNLLREKTEAIGYYKQALAFSRMTNDRRGQAASMDSLGSIVESFGDKKRASLYFNQALSLSQRAGDRGQQSLTLFHLAHLERDSNDLQAARNYIEEAIRIVETLRTKVVSQDYRAEYFASTRGYYELLLDIMTRLNNQKPDRGYATNAFRVSEQARARSLLELIKETHINLREGVSDDLLQQERKLEEALDAKAGRRAQLVAAGNDKELSAVTTEINKLTTEYDELKAQIKAKSPRYASLIQPQPLSATEVQHQLLDDDSLLLEYMLGDDRSYLWAVTRTNIEIFELPSRSQIEDSARRFHKLLTANQPVQGETFEQLKTRVSDADAHMAEETLSFSSLVFGPVIDRLTKKRLLIVADGALEYIPFQALVVPAAATFNPSTGATNTNEQVPLIVDHEVINEPSASALAMVMSDAAQRRPAPNSIAVFADPVFEANDSRVTRSETQSAAGAPQKEVQTAFRDVGLGEGKSIPSLPASREEANAIMAVVPWRSGLKALGFDASRAAINGTDLSKYRIVHFATHGLVDYQHPDLSGLVLSLVDEKGNPQDGFLRMHDIYNLKLPVDLIVLSACNTGLGREVKGEGLMGLTRGFMYAGAGGVVASLWKVDDDATAELMKHFYEGIFQKNMTPAAALREAQLSMWKQKRWQSPYYWAAFVIQGQYDQKELAGQRISAPKIVAVVAGILALSIMMGFFLRRRRRKIL